MCTTSFCEKTKEKVLLKKRLLYTVLQVTVTLSMIKQVFSDFVKVTKIYCHKE